MPVVIEELSVDVAPPPRDSAAERQPDQPARPEHGAEAALEALAYQQWRRLRLAAD
jgi:hypothetical protein